MANIFLFTTIVIVVSSSVNSERRSFLRYSNILQKAVPHIWKHDQEELNRNMVKNSGQPQVRAGPRLPPLRPVPSAPWPLRIHQNQLTDKELTQKRVHQLQNKLTPNIIIPVRKINQPHPKPEIEVRSRESKRHKRDTTQSDNDTRQKRQVIINPQLQLEVVMQPHIQPAPMQENEAQYQEKITEKRDKRQILLMIKQQRPLAFAKKPRTTPNPFIRETNIADYDIVRPDTYKPEVEVINTADTDSYQLSPIQKVLSEITKMLLNLKSWLDTPKEDPLLQLRNSARVKRSPKMSKLYKKQKLAKKKRKKKKQRKPSPRQIKHFRRIREHREERKRILHKKLKEKRRLRHKKMGTGPYNKSIIDYYGVYFDSSSSQLNDSLYDSIYDTNAVDSEQMYAEHMKNYTDYDEEEEDEDEDEDEEYSEESSEEKISNTTVNYYDPPSTKLNDSLFNSIYDTEAVDSDKMYEEHKKNYPDSEEDEESEEESNDVKTGSSDISKGDDDKGKDNTRKASTENKKEDKNKDKSGKLQNKSKDQLLFSRKEKNMIKPKTIERPTSIKNDKMQKKHSVHAFVQRKTSEKSNVLNKYKSASKLSDAKQSANQIAKRKLSSKNAHTRNNSPPIQIKVKQTTQSTTKYNTKSNLLDIIFDKPKHDITFSGANYPTNLDSILFLNDLIRPKQQAHLQDSSFENIIPTMIRPGHRRVPI